MYVSSGHLWRRIIRNGSAALPSFSARIVQSSGSTSLAAPGRNLRRADSQVSQRGRGERDHIRPFGLTGNDGLVGDSFVSIASKGSGYLAAFQGYIKPRKRYHTILLPRVYPRKTQWLCRRLLFRTGFPAYRR